MGSIRRMIRFGSEDGSTWVDAEALVDTGSTHCQIPEPVAAQLKARVVYQTRVRLADGSIGTRDVVIVVVQLDPSLPAIPTTAVVGGERSPFLIGAVLLEQLGVGLDPQGNRLIPVIADLLELTGWPRF